jgi:hypothetical protein
LTMSLVGSPAADLPLWFAAEYARLVARAGHIAAQYAADRRQIEKEAAVLGASMVATVRKLMTPPAPKLKRGRPKGSHSRKAAAKSNAWWRTYQAERESYPDAPDRDVAVLMLKRFHPKRKDFTEEQVRSTAERISREKAVRRSLLDTPRAARRKKPDRDSLGV